MTEHVHSDRAILRGRKYLLLTNCSRTIPDMIWRAYPDSWYHLPTIANSGSHFSARKSSNQPGFGETTVTRIHTTSFTQCSTVFDSESWHGLCWTCTLLLLHKPSLGSSHIQIGYGRRYGGGSHVIGGIDSHLVTFEYLSTVIAIFVPTLPRGSLFLMAVTKLWEMIFQ